MGDGFDNYDNFLNTDNINYTRDELPFDQDNKKDELIKSLENENVLLKQWVDALIQKNNKLINS